jgi:hypothetical protein
MGREETKGGDEGNEEDSQRRNEVNEDERRDPVVGLTQTTQLRIRVPPR